MFKIIQRFAKDVRFASTKQNENFRRVFSKRGQPQTPTPTPTPLNSPTHQIPKGYFIKTTVAAIGFTGCCFAGCSILYYENVLNKIKLPGVEKRLDIRSQLNQYWNNLTTFQKYVVGIIGLNTLVLIAWRVPRLGNIVPKYFLNFPKKEAMYSSLLFSTFSHISPMHLIFNMFALYSFSSALESILGAEQFLAFYLSSGFIASYLSNNIKGFLSIVRPSVGASGALLACFAVICMAYPDSQFRIIFFPFIDFKAKDLLIGVIAFDILGLLWRRSGFDHIAHLCGTFFGIWYYKWGHVYLWESQKSIIKRYHELKTKSK